MNSNHFCFCKYYCQLKFRLKKCYSKATIYIHIIYFKAEVLRGKLHDSREFAARPMIVRRAFIRQRLYVRIVSLTRIRNKLEGTLERRCIHIVRELHTRPPPFNCHLCRSLAPCYFTRWFRAVLQSSASKKKKKKNTQTATCSTSSKAQNTHTHTRTREKQNVAK